MYWLFKTEPGDYSFNDLVRERQTVWSGVRNALARANLRKVEPGDEIFIYHTGKEKAIIGVAQAVSTSYEREDGETAVDITPKYALTNSISLATIKEVKQFASWDLVRLPRLSVMQVTPDDWFALHEMARQPENA
ncbi:MAG TPA: EVE domain-containing protein [Bacillota bacterium]|nr:EVE domain-containing protein [Bacillota bacterium]